MKRILIFLLTINLASEVLSQSHVGSTFRTLSYYGFSGMTFIPTAQVLPERQWDISYMSKPARGEDLSLSPFSVQLGYSFLKGDFECVLTNTAMYASKKDLNGVAIEYGYPNLSTDLPIFPSVKYRFMPMIKENYNVAMAIGFALPYGAYYAIDKFFNARLCDLTVHTGVASKLTTYHAFAGMTFSFGKRIGFIERDFPLEMLWEAGWGGSLKQLNEKEETFFAISFRQAWTASLYIKTFFRIDNQPIMENGITWHASPTKRMGIGLDYSWYSFSKKGGQK
jgi:hypothetical protein